MSKSRGVRIQNLKRLWAWLESHPCHCGETNPALLELNHTNPADKTAAVGRLMKTSWARVEAELLKCTVMCVRCHRLHTMAQRGFYLHHELRAYLAAWPENRAAFNNTLNDAAPRVTS